MPRHVFANPSSPNICPILALAIYVFSLPVVGSVNESPMLFGQVSSSNKRDSAENRFSSWLSRVFECNQSDILKLGLNIKDLGLNFFLHFLCIYYHY